MEINHSQVAPALPLPPQASQRCRVTLPISVLTRSSNWLCKSCHPLRTYWFLSSKNQRILSFWKWKKATNKEKQTGQNFPALEVQMEIAEAFFPVFLDSLQKPLQCLPLEGTTHLEAQAEAVKALEL